MKLNQLCNNERVHCYTRIAMICVCMSPSHLTHHSSHPTPHSSHITPHPTHHTSLLTPHTSHVTLHTSLPVPSVFLSSNVVPLVHEQVVLVTSGSAPHRHLDVWNGAVSNVPSSILHAGHTGPGTRWRELLKHVITLCGGRSGDGAY